MDKFPISPDQDGYGFKFDSSEVTEATEGGVIGRYNRGIWNAAVPVSVKWSTIDATDFNLINTAFQTHIDEGGAPFAIDLLIDKATVREYMARFIPDSWSLDSVSQDAYTVSAKLEVQPRRMELTNETWPADLLIT